MKYDIAVIGSGFAGSLLAMIACRLGHSTVLIDKDSHPRFAIGESSTPLANLLLEELATHYDLPSVALLSKWGSWQLAHPQLACGLKRGFTFYRHELGSAAASCPDRKDQLLVAASPRDEIADTHWFRADFDQFLVNEAQNLGINYFDKVTLDRCDLSSEEVQLAGRREGQDVEFSAQFVIDATGPRGFLHRVLGLKELELPDYPHTQGLFNHFSSVARLDEVQFGRTDELLPYPIDDAAVHHIFDGGWIWTLRFNNGITSAGVAATDEAATRLRFDEGAGAWQRLIDQIPALQAQFVVAKAERSFTHIQRLPFRTSQIVGKKWAMLPSAAGFVDPLLSTGFPLTLLGISRIAEIIERHWGADDFQIQLRSYAQQTEDELLATSRLIASLYANMSNFDVFIALALLYFAAASFSETARRLGRSELASSFLLCRDPTFGPTAARICDLARQPLQRAQSNELIQHILATIEPFNVAGFGRPERRNWYPVVADDLVDAAAKFGADAREMYALLRRCGFSS